MCFEFLSKHRDLGLLILRVGIGAMFILHGYPLMTGGPATWEKLGMATSHIGIHFAPVIFGFLAALSEFGGGIFIILGLLFRPACFFLTVTMTVAAIMHLTQGDDLNMASHSIESGILFFSLIFIGPGTYSLDEKVHISLKK